MNRPKRFCLGVGCLMVLLGAIRKSVSRSGTRIYRRAGEGQNLALIFIVVGVVLAGAGLMIKS